MVVVDLSKVVRSLRLVRRREQEEEAREVQRQEEEEGRVRPSTFSFSN